ncbi:MAG: hypothetical protein JST22_09075 [Bacteroidetes bacterium]|nr:hypothetical protein [Bacteroidota bacterium]
MTRSHGNTMRFSAALFAACVLALGVAPRAQAQGFFSFGPPLRPNIVFAYKYVERVTERHVLSGQVIDSSERVLNYYISERQVPKSNGLIGLEANVDSMEIDIRGIGGHVYFNTQRIDQVSDKELVRNRDVFGPSALVNRMVTFNMTPYGKIVSVESASRKQALEDLMDPAIDPFTRQRLREVFTDEYMTSVFLPWRNVVPLGQKVPYAKQLRVPFQTAFDRLSFRDTAMVQVVKEPDNAPHLRFSSELDRPLNSEMTITAFDEPVKVTSAHARVGGDLKLDDDGVVLSGWTTMNGTIVTMRNGAPVTSTVTHEVFVQQIGMGVVNNSQ